MPLLGSEQDRLLLFLAAELARRRRGRGLRLTEGEARALIADEVCEAVRDGADYPTAVATGRELLTAADVLDGVPELLTRIEVEPMFGDGHRLIVLDHPLLPFSESEEPAPSWGDGPEIAIVNHAGVSVGLTSHLHLFEANRALELDRSAAWGMHLDLPPGEKVHLAPGESLTVRMRPFGGARRIRGHSPLVDGLLDEPGAREAALERARTAGYRGA